MGMIMKNGVPYAHGSEIPQGGTKGQALVKASNLDGDVEWGGAVGGGGLPSGGAKGDIIVKKSSADGDVEWTPLDASEWGVVRTGVTTVTFNGGKWSSSTTVDVSDLGFSSGADYDVVAQPTTGGTVTPWGNAIAYVNADKGASSFSVSSVTMEESLSGTINVKYVIFAKGYGTTVGGGGGSITIDTAMDDNSENAVQNKVIKKYVDNIQGLPSGGENGQILARNSMSPDNAEWIDNPSDNTFIFDVDSDQFTEDSDNPDGNHYGMTITSPTYDELLSMLVANKFVYVRLLYNSGNAYEIMQLFHNGNSIYGRYFDVEFPQKRLMFASAYVNKRNNDTTYFGTYQDYISGGTVDQTYDATSENAQSGTAVAEALATVDGNTTFDVTPIPQGPTGANEINAVISNKDSENARVSYVRQSDGTLPSTVNLGVKSGLGDDSFELPTKALVDNAVGATNTRVTELETLTDGLTQLTITMVDGNNVSHTYKLLGVEVTTP